MVDQILRPTADDSIGGWTNESDGTTNLYLSISEVTASALEYVQSSADPANDVVRFKLDPSAVDPQVSDGYVFDYWIGKSGSGSIDLTVRIVQGAATQIASWAHSDIAAGPTPVSQTLTAGEANLITDHTDLYLEFIANTGIVYLLRDQFNDADIDPLVDSAATPGPGGRIVTGTDIRIEDQALQGIQQSASPVWGNSKITWDGQTRVGGLTMWALVIPSDRDAELGIGWASSEAVTDPRVDGHHWIIDEGYPRVGSPGKDLLLSGLGVGSFGAMRAVEYLVGVTLREHGAFYWMSAVGPHTDFPANSNDHIGVPQYPDARVLWVDDTDTTSPMYPHIGALTPIAHGHWVDDVRVNVIDDWASPAGLATFYDDVDRPDSTTSPGGLWTVGLGTWGVSSGKLYVQAHNGTTYNYLTVATGLSNGDGIFRMQFTMPTTTTDEFVLMLRFIDINNMLFVGNAGTATSLWLYKRVGGAFNSIANYPVSWVGGQEYDLCVIAKGSMYQVYLDGTLLLDWTDDGTGGFFNNATAMAVGLYPLAVGGRIDNVMAAPSTIALPDAIRVGAVPHIFTPGSSIFTDDFTAPDGTALSGRTTTTGGLTWGVNGSGYQINSNRAGNTNINLSGGDYFAFVDCGVSDVEWEATVVLPNGGDTVRTGALLRYTDANNFMYARLWEGVEQAVNNEIEVIEVSGGVPGAIHKMQFGDYFTLTGESYTLKCQIVGDLLHVFLNGDAVISYHIRNVLSGTKHGLYHSGNDDGTSFDFLEIKNLS